MFGQRQSFLTPGANRFRNLANFAALVRHLKGVGRCSDLLADICSAAHESSPATTPLGPGDSHCLLLRHQRHCYAFARTGEASRASSGRKRAAGQAAVPPVHPRRQGPRRKKRKKSRGHALGFSHRQAESGQRDKRGGMRSRPLGRLPQVGYHDWPFTPHGADGRSVGMR